MNNFDNIIKDTLAGDSLIKRSLDLSNYLRRIESNYRTRGDFEINFNFHSVCEMLNCFAWAYPVNSKSVETSKIDRLSPMLIGPLFTSDRHPWPMQGGRYLEPLIQFDLEWIGEKAQVNLGKGILQLWLDSLSELEGHHYRIIPKEDFDKDFVSSMPSDINRHYFEDSLYFAGYEDSWLDEEGPAVSVVMTEIGEPIMTWHRSLRDSLEDLAYNMADDYAPPISEYLEILPADSPTPTPHFFGISDPVQYDPAEMPPCLLALDSQGPYIWGDCGNAQLFYLPREDGTIHFDFAWSCP
jgi:hypothetical protein